MFRLRVEGLLTLEVVDAVEDDVIHVLVLGGVVHDVLVEAGELVVQLGLEPPAINHLLKADLNTGDDKVGVLHMPVPMGVDASSVMGATEALLFTILMNPPQIVNTVVRGLVVTVPNQQGRNNCPESDILRLEFEES